MLQRMNRIRVIGPKKDFRSTVDTLYQAGSVHLEDTCSCVASDQICLTQVRTESLNDIPSVLVKIDGIFYTLPRTGENSGLKEQFERELGAKTHEQIVERAGNVISELEWTTKDLALNKSDLETSIAAMNRYEKVINRIRHIEPELPLLAGYEVNILIIQKEYTDVIALLKKELGEITGDRYEFMHMDIDDKTLAAIAVYNKKYSNDVHSFVFSANLNEVRLPPDFYGKSFDEMIGLIDSRRKHAAEEITHINKKLEKLSDKWYIELSVLKRLLEDINEEINTFCKFGHSEYTFVIQGWIPAKSVKKIGDMMKREYGGRVVIEILDVEEKDFDNAPSVYDNPAIVKPFEFFMNLVRPPKYREVDPSPIMAIFFPIFFGIMVGDVGYGLIILTLAAAVKFRYRAVTWLTDMANIMIISSIPAILFGVLFGEFFGNLGEELGILHPMHIGITWNRVEAIIPMLILVLAIGAFHVFLGLGIGLYNAAIQKKKKHVVEKIATMGVITGILLTLISAGGVLPQPFVWAGIITMLISIPLVFYGGGIFGTIELISSVGNILSYARLMAIGMASVMLALVANEFAGPEGVAVIGIFAAIMLHGLNVALGMFSPSIHAMRLHLVEFFSKFYEGGGRPYKPFRKIGKPD